MTDFLLELLSEEIPARMQSKASADLARLFEAELAKSGLAAAAIETFATPRRLALIARDLPAQTAAVQEETKGPRASAPPQALEGFLRKTGLTQDQLVERDDVWFAVVDKPGRATADVLAEAIPAIIRAFPWPKSMRWGEASASTESLRWVRPLQGIVALLGEEIVDFEIAGIRCGAATVGHRFHHPGIITIGSAADYAEKLRACHVIVDARERQQIIRNAAGLAAEACGLHLVEDEGLIAENAGLTEWPVPLLGRFDRAFLDVPREVIQLTMRTNQKYFALTDGEGALAPNFLCTANIAPADGGAAIVAGNEKVLAARLSDAKFFWEGDLKIPLEDQAKKLEQIVFHEKLGTVADKVDRVAKLARWLVEEGIVTSKPLPFRGGVGEGNMIPSLTSEAGTADKPLPNPSPEGEGLDLAALAERAARLCKADLVTGMVGEFPELQGLIGGYLARAQGEDPQVADAIRDHYKPVGQGDEVPTAPVTVAVSLADKLDTLVGFFAVGEAPSGSRDPFALRRAAISAIGLALKNRLRFNLDILVLNACLSYATNIVEAEKSKDERFKRIMEDFWPKFPAGAADSKVYTDNLKEHNYELYQMFLEKVLPVLERAKKFLTPKDTAAKSLDFFADRLKVQQREAGVRHDLIDAVFALGGEDDLVRLLARVRALQSFVETPEGRDLLAGYKRAANILKKEDWSGAAPKTLSYTPSDEEAALIAALDSAEPRARAAVEAEDFEGAMAALASLRGPVDAFFEKVTVNDPDPAKREARLGLLARVRDAVHAVADFSRIEG
ncbi:MAG TPA: glycine--tRNA ligase subunit beta [Allosphingosinicella sp.]|jgi:glycyl-tRNA synthetase beta chain